MQLTKDQWYLLTEKEREEWVFVSDETGCYFTEKEKQKNDTEVVDDFERLTKEGDS